MPLRCLGVLLSMLVSLGFPNMGLGVKKSNIDEVAQKLHDNFST